MREQLSFILKENGFMFPSVLLVCTVVLLTFSTNIFSLQHDLKMTYNLIEQVKSQTLFQMGYTKYKKEYLENINSETVEYHFPNGKVMITLEEVEDMNHILFKIETDKEYYSTVTKTLKTSTYE
ncbi:hypothetical protein [Ornithinibacillus sp. 179-J 7C1 HS]|uniref:hypothetical protein n=1 Tax=Ornithinibacillus sp. 179-J 7C1 HS TaxID=3142384 RepID=UPI0039A3567E